MQRCVRQYNELLANDRLSHVLIEEIKVRKLIPFSSAEIINLKAVPTERERVYPNARSYSTV